MENALKSLLSEIGQIQREISFFPEVSARHNAKELASLKHLAALLADRLAQLQWALEAVRLKESVSSNTPSEKVAQVSEKTDTPLASDGSAVTPPVFVSASIEPTPLVHDIAEPISIADKLRQQPIGDLRRAFGLNERFFYTNELFNGDGEEFSRAINELNHLSGFDDALKLIDAKYREMFQWKEEDETVQTFLALIQRRYL